MASAAPVWKTGTAMKAEASSIVIVEVVEKGFRIEIFV